MWPATKYPVLPYYGSVTTPFVAAALILVTSQIDPLPPVIREAVLPVRHALIEQVYRMSAHYLT